MGEPATLVKSGRLEHLQQLQNEGLLDMNPLRCFCGIGFGEPRGPDRLEIELPTTSKSPWLLAGPPAVRRCLTGKTGPRRE